VIQFIEPNVVNRIQVEFNNDLWSITGPGTPILLTNGQTAPFKPVLAGIWYRFRVLFTSIASGARLYTETESGTATCEMQLLAKDGVYLGTAPRLITNAYLTAAARADVMVRCLGTGTVNVNANVITNVADQGTYVAVALAVSGPQAPSADLVPFSVYRPCYLVDTRPATPATSLQISLGGGNPNTVINGELYSGPENVLNPTDPFTTGTLGEVLIVQGTFVHSLHIHVNHFQFSTISAVVDEVYFQEGDWHDTFSSFVAQGAPGPDLTRAVIRFWADRFSGRAVVHCHMSNHEDEGMMNAYMIDGDEGATVDALARRIDPLCYSDFQGRGFTR